MLRAVLLLAAIALSGCASSGIRIGYDPNESHFETIKEHPLKQGEAFDRAIAWIAVNYNSANSVIQLKDRESGMVVVKAIETFSMLGISSRMMRYTLQIKIKDEKAKFTYDLGGLASEPGIPEQPNYAPPRDAMPQIVASLNGISDKIAAEWKTPAKDDF